MSSRTSNIQCLDVGTPSPEFQSQGSQEWEAIDVRFHNFENLPTAAGNVVYSPEFTCFRHKWRVALYPGGLHTDFDGGKVVLLLCNMSDESITIKFDFGVKNALLFHISFTFQSFASVGTYNTDDGICDRWGGGLFERSGIIRALDEGALIVEFRLLRLDALGSGSMPFVAENPLSAIVLGKFNNEESADVAFVVGGGEGPPATFYGHKFILEDCAPELAAAIASGENSTTIPIPDVKPEIFRHLLYYMYGGKVAEDDLKANAKDIINAADKYGVAGLKLEAEAILVVSTTIAIDNVMELLLFADQKNCALLKEATMDFIVNNNAEVVKDLSFFYNFPGHLTRDVLMAYAMDDSMRVSALRMRLHGRGLAIDGSREALIARLEESS